MFTLGITLVSDSIKINSIASHPVIFEVVTSSLFKKGLYNHSNLVIFDGFELTTTLFSDNANFLNHNIIDDFYWFYSTEEIDNNKSYHTELKSFIFKFIFKNKLNFKTKIIFKEEQLININSPAFLIEDKIKKISYLFDGETLFIVDINYFEFIKNKKISKITELIKLDNLKLITFDDLKLNLKVQGLVDKTFSFNNFYDYFRYFDFETENFNEFYKWLTVYFYNIYNYTSIDVKINKKINSELLNINGLDRYSNFYENIMIIENYLSNIKIKNIDFNKFPELEFPITNNLVQYKYNGSDTVTGRIFPIELNNKQSLQTLNKEQRSILNADKGCSFIEFDYQSFEFDLLCQLAGITKYDNLDPHIEAVKYLFSEDFINDDIIDFRKMGKDINYSLIYGMNTDKIIESIINYFFNEEDNIENEENILGLKNILKIKIENYDIKQAVKCVTDNILLNHFNESNFLLQNYFGRFIRVEKKHAILNNFISSSAADFLYIKIRMIIDLLELRKVNLKKNKIILQNHDSILIQLEDKIINETDAFETINQIMKADINGLKGRVKFNYGTNWINLK